MRRSSRLCRRVSISWMSSQPQPRIDRSSTVRILNGLSVNLTLVSKRSVDGEWDYSTGRNPPPSVPAGRLSSEILLRDSFGPAGSEGWFTYRIGNSGQIIGMHFACPMWLDNWARWFQPSNSQTITSATLFPLQFNLSGPLDVQFAVGLPGSRIRPRIARHLGFSLAGNQILDDGGTEDMIEEIVVTDIPVEEVDDEASH
ncbi:uncharacterized protein BJ212DRAFT_1350064 [Suillus subaureus]|uniref:Uncharacterized protein n=1 Tax=Suillus subaureus TaxID=48587 RepID=A0A9P7EDH8_9AGAM|nr:uncharacterized protein BJ212DRAFT_1350064 [Suillus subaureus]KAG1817668.1 hypothetical protein BJ212DRAFT_1350064 [Suillus subaureus]